MKKISTDAKILNITHVDLDGCGCTIVLNSVFKNMTYIFASFYNIDKKMENIKYDDYDYVILTDIHPKDKKYLYLSDKIVMIDHHPSKLNDPSNMIFEVSNKNVCATVLVKHFIENTYKVDLSYLDEFVKMVNDYDMWNLKYPLGRYLNDLMFYKYKPVDFITQFANGRTYLYKSEVEFLKKLYVEFNKVYDEVEIRDFVTINACLMYEYKFINDIAHKLLTEENYKMVVARDQNRGRVSIRMGDIDIDIGKVLEEFEWGGGHPKSSGFFVEDHDEFMKRIKKLEKYLYDKYEGIRKC